MSPINVKNALNQQLQFLHQLGIDKLTLASEALTFELSKVEHAALTQSPAGQASLKPANKSVVDQSSTPKKAISAQSPPPAPTSIAAASPVQPVTKPPQQSIETKYSGPALGRDEREQQLTVLATEVEQCQACPELCQNRQRTVFGTGTPEAKVVFLGQSPGADEERLGKPFAGEAGKLLDKILTAAKLEPSQIYLLTTVKCSPPKGRNPQASELNNCRSFLDRQLEIIRPDYIVCLGSVAAKSLLNTNQSLGQLRKQFHNYRGSKTLVTYHPAYLLRTPTAKIHVWDDMKMLMNEFGVKLT